jgi:hypothetical protein
VPGAEHGLTAACHGTVVSTGRAAPRAVEEPLGGSSTNTS